MIMKSNEVKEALKVHLTDELCCSTCPITCKYRKYVKDTCIDLLLRDVNEYIKQLESENNEVFDNYTQAVFLQNQRIDRARKQLVERIKKELSFGHYITEDQLDSILEEMEAPTGDPTKIADHLVAEGVIVPPCKVGDTVYAVGDKGGHQIKECRVSHFGFENQECFEVFVYFDCDLHCDGCYFNAYSQSYCGEWDCDNTFGHSSIPISEFGKTVFLTKEEAENALKERKGK